MFDDLDDYDDDFEESGASGKRDGDNFNANELLNFSDYQNRRREATQPEPTEKSGVLNVKDVLNGSAAQKINAENMNSQAYDGEIEVADDWGDDWGEDEEEDLDNVDYTKTDLNKLGDAALARHKKAMDKNFNANQLKPGDAGFEYDKRVEFPKGGNDSPLQDDSWGAESDEEVAEQEHKEQDDDMQDYGEDDDDDDMDYFDDDFS